MADNFASYNRFTSLPANIARFGVTPEEIKIQQGEPDKNPLISPMASPKVAETRLSLGAGGSDRLRLAQPHEPTLNPYEGPKSNLVLARTAVRKLAGGVLRDLHSLVQTSTSLDPKVSGLMGDSLKRISAMREFMTDLNRLTESIYVRSIAASKG